MHFFLLYTDHHFDQRPSNNFNNLSVSPSPPPLYEERSSTQPSPPAEQGIGIEKEALNHSIYIYCQSQTFGNNLNSSISIPMHWRRGLVLTVCACVKYSVIFSIKSFAHLLSPYAEDFTNQEYRAFFELDSSDNLTCRTLLGYYFSDEAVSFFQMYSQTKR